MAFPKLPRWEDGAPSPKSEDISNSYIEPAMRAMRRRYFQPKDLPDWEWVCSCTEPYMDTLEPWELEWRQMIDRARQELREQRGTPFSPMEVARSYDLRKADVAAAEEALRARPLLAAASNTQPPIENDAAPQQVRRRFLQQDAPDWFFVLYIADSDSDMLNPWERDWRQSIDSLTRRLQDKRLTPPSVWEVETSYEQWKARAQAAQAPFVIEKVTPVPITFRSRATRSVNAPSIQMSTDMAEPLMIVGQRGINKGYLLGSGSNGFYYYCEEPAGAEIPAELRVPNATEFDRLGPDVTTSQLIDCLTARYAVSDEIFLTLLGTPCPWLPTYSLLWWVDGRRTWTGYPPLTYASEVPYDDGGSEPLYRQLSAEQQSLISYPSQRGVRTPLACIVWADRMSARHEATLASDAGTYLEGFRSLVHAWRWERRMLVGQHLVDLLARVANVKFMRWQSVVDL